MSFLTTFERVVGVVKCTAAENPRVTINKMHTIAWNVLMVVGIRVVVDGAQYHLVGTFFFVEFHVGVNVFYGRQTEQFLYFSLSLPLLLPPSFSNAFIKANELE
jgi:hypothetical protein